MRGLPTWQASRSGSVEFPGVFFDLCLSALDLLDLFAQVPSRAGRVRIRLPIRAPAPNRPLLVSIRSARLAGFDDARLRAMLGETARGIVEEHDRRRSRHRSEQRRSRNP